MRSNGATVILLRDAVASSGRRDSLTNTRHSTALSTSPHWPLAQPYTKLPYRHSIARQIAAGAGGAAYAAAAGHHNRNRSAPVDPVHDQRDIKLDQLKLLQPSAERGFTCRSQTTSPRFPSPIPTRSTRICRSSS